jgi:hypothetical protein
MTDIPLSMLPQKKREKKRVGRMRVKFIML